MADPTPLTSPETQALPRNVKVLGGVSLLNDIASEMIYPLLPTFLLTFVTGGNKFLLGIIEGSAESVGSVLKLWSGGWSDQSGRRKGFVLIGYALATIVRPLIALVVAPWQLFTLRVVDRFGKGIRTPARDALIADSTSQGMRGRAFGFHQAMDHLGSAIGPVLAFVFLWFWPGELRTLFLLTIIPGVAVLALLFFGLREPAATVKPAEKLHLTLAPFDRNFRIYLLALALFTLGNSSDAFLLVRAKELGVPTEWLPILWAVFGIVKSLSNLLIGRAVDRVGKARPFVFAGWFVYAALYLAFGWATSAWQVWVFFLCYALFYGLTEPAEKTLVVSLVGKERKGLAFGWFHCAIGIATLPSSMIFGALYQEYGALAAFGWSASMALLAALLLGVVRERRD